MVSFSSDVDILKYEPILFGELHLPWQVIESADDGVLNGTSFTSAGADFVGSQVSVGGVIYLWKSDGSFDSCCEIVSVNSATELTVSVLRADSESGAISAGSASSVSYRISTLGPQAAQAGFELTEYFAIKPGNPASEIDAADILDTDVLKPASVFLVISSVYAMLASKSDKDNFWTKSLHYRRLFEKARQRCRLSIDAGSDGVADIVSSGGSVRLVRC